MAGGITFDSELTIIELHSGILFVPGGDVHRSFQHVKNELVQWTHEFAPPRRSEARWGTWSRGALQASIYGNLYTLADHTLGVEAGARVPYAKYVHNGTAQETGYIYTTAGFANAAIVDSWIDNRQLRGSADDSGFWMPITRIPLKTKYFLRVRGQKANPFLHNAYDRTRYDHSMLPRMTW
jgi:hypothetical protein